MSEAISDSRLLKCEGVMRSAIPDVSQELHDRAWAAYDRMPPGRDKRLVLRVLCFCELTREIVDKVAKFSAIAVCVDGSVPRAHQGI